MHFIFLHNGVKIYTHSGLDGLILRLPVDSPVLRTRFQNLIQTVLLLF